MAPIAAVAKIEMMPRYWLLIHAAPAPNPPATVRSTQSIRPCSSSSGTSFTTSGRHRNVEKRDTTAPTDAPCTPYANLMLPVATLVATDPLYTPMPIPTNFAGV